MYTKSSFLCAIFVILSGCASVRFQDKIVDPKARTVATRDADTNQCLGDSYRSNAFGNSSVQSRDFYQCMVNKGYDIED